MTDTFDKGHQGKIEKERKSENYTAFYHLSSGQKTKIFITIIFFVIITFIGIVLTQTVSYTINSLQEEPFFLLGEKENKELEADTETNNLGELSEIVLECLRKHLGEEGFQDLLINGIKDDLTEGKKAIVNQCQQTSNNSPTTFLR